MVFAIIGMTSSNKSCAFSPNIVPVLALGIPFFEYNVGNMEKGM